MLQFKMSWAMVAHPLGPESLTMHVTCALCNVLDSALCQAACSKDHAGKQDCMPSSAGRALRAAVKLNASAAWGAASAYQPRAQMGFDNVHGKWPAAAGLASPSHASSSSSLQQVKQQSSSSAAVVHANAGWGSMGAGEGGGTARAEPEAEELRAATLPAGKFAWQQQLPSQPRIAPRMRPAVKKRPLAALLAHQVGA